MWKSRKEDEKPSYTPPAPPKPSVQTPVQNVPYQNTSAATQAPVTRPLETPRMENYRSDVAHIGKSVIVKGELSGSEDLYLDGEVEGNIELRGHSLIIGPNGRVRANVHARDVVIHGKVDGNVRGTEKVELKKTALLNGDIATARIVIEDGAFFKGAIDIQKTETKAPETRQPAAAAAAPASGQQPAATNAQGSLIDRK